MASGAGKVKFHLQCSGFVFLILWILKSDPLFSEQLERAAVFCLTTFTAVFPAKGSYGIEGQLHTVIEKSPESSPTTKPRQGGGFPQPPSPPESSSGSEGPGPQAGRLILHTGMYHVPQPEPHYAQMPSSNPGTGSSGIGGRDEGVTERQRDGKILTENGHQNSISSSSAHPHSSYSRPPSSQLRRETQEADR